MAPLVNLKSIDLGATQTTDAGLVHLRALKKLRSFCGGLGVTQDGVIALKKDFPGLFVPEEFKANPPTVTNPGH